MERKSIKLRLLEWLHHFGISDEGLFYFLTIVVGVIAGIVAVAFHLAIGIMHTVYFGSHDLPFLYAMPEEYQKSGFYKRRPRQYRPGRRLYCHQRSRRHQSCHRSGRRQAG